MNLHFMPDTLVKSTGDVHYEADVLNELYGGGKYDDPGDGHNWYDDGCWMPQ